MSFVLYERDAFGRSKHPSKPSNSWEEAAYVNLLLFVLKKKKKVNYTSSFGSMDLGVCSPLPFQSSCPQLFGKSSCAQLRPALLVMTDTERSCAPLQKVRGASLLQPCQALGLDVPTLWKINEHAEHFNAKQIFLSDQRPSLWPCAQSQGRRPGRQAVSARPLEKMPRLSGMVSAGRGGQGGRLVYFSLWSSQSPPPPSQLTPPPPPLSPADRLCSYVSMVFSSVLVFIFLRES